MTRFQEKGSQYRSDVTRINGIDVYDEYTFPQRPIKTLLFIHGFLSSSFSFRRLIPLLKEQYNLLAIDYPPFGKSGKSLTFQYSYQNIANTLLQLIDELKLPNLYVVGHSLGGQIGLHMVVQRSNLFRGIVLLAGSGYLKRAKKPLLWASRLPFFHLIVKGKLLRSGGVEGNLQQVVYEKAMITQEMIDGYMEPYVKDQMIFRALGKFLRDREDDLSPDVLRTITIPCLLVWGQQDQIVPLDVGKRFARDLPRSELIIIEKTGHLLPEEKPEKTAAVIRHFLENTNF